MNTFLRACFCLVLPASLVVPAEAGAPAKGTPTGITDTVTAVGSDSITIHAAATAGTHMKVTNIDSDGNTKIKGPSNIVTYKVDPLTSIVVDGLKSKLSDVKAGMKVDVEIGMDPEVLASITAHTAPPPPKAPPKKLPKGATPPPGIGMDRVLAITADRITIGSSSNKYPRAYFITPYTAVKLDGLPSDVKAIHVGMDVHIVISDQTTAAEIHIHNVKE